MSGPLQEGGVIAVRSVVARSSAVDELAAGRMVVLRWSSRGTGGDLLIAAQFVAADSINFMAKEARGLVSLALTGELSQALALEPIPPTGSSSLGGQAMVSIEAASGITTGISAADRARTIAAATAPDASAGDLVSPGHVFPLRARSRGFGGGPGRVEAAIELSTAAGLRPAAVLCQVLDDNGRLADRDHLSRLAAAHGLATVTIHEAFEAV